MARNGTTLDQETCAAIATECACANLRKASRAVTQLFDGALAPVGVRSTQLVVLLAIGATGTATIPGLSQELILESSTLTRTLQGLEQRGLVARTPGRDRRRIGVILTAEGRRLMLEAFPLWREAQTRLVAHLGAETWADLKVKLAEAVGAARQ